MCLIHSAYAGYLSRSHRHSLQRCEVVVQLNEDRCRQADERVGDGQGEDIRSVVEESAQVREVVLVLIGPVEDPQNQLLGVDDAYQLKGEGWGVPLGRNRRGRSI